MKKILVALAFVAASTAAMAADVTVSAGRSTGVDSNVGSVAVGSQFGAVRGEVSVGRSFKNGLEANTLGVAASYPLITVAGVNLAAKAGVTYVAPLNAAVNGYAASAGVEATYPLTKNLTLVGAVERVAGQERINAINGNNLTVGLRSSF